MKFFLFGQAYFFKRIFFFKCGPFLEIFIEFATILLLFYVLVSGQEACEVLAP